MLPVTETYGAWPRSGEIDILESRGNNYTCSLGGNNFAFSALHWGPNAKNDGYKLTSNNKPALHSQLGDKFHVYGLEWSEKYLFTYMDNVLRQVMYFPFTSPLYPQGYFPNSDSNGTVLSNPWAGTGRTNSPFDQEFYLIINVAVGGQNGWFRDGSDGKPWVDSSSSAKKDFWEKRGGWYPTWQGDGRGEMVVDSVKMWQQC
jgi:beta-glucanase (GH16 family)